MEHIMLFVLSVINESQKFVSLVVMECVMVSYSMILCMYVSPHTQCSHDAVHTFQ